MAESLFEQLFGFELKRKQPKGELETFNLDKDVTADGAILQDQIPGAGGGIATYSYDAAQIPVEELDLINTYRSMSMSSEIDEALQEIRNEIFIYDVPGERAFELAFTEEKGAPPVSIQKKIINEFHELYRIVDFHNRGPQYFDDWYIDSKLYLHKMIDTDHPKDGIQKVVSIDPLKIRRVRIIPRPDQNGVFDTNKIKEVFIYSNRFTPNFTLNGVTDIQFGQNVHGLQIHPDAITYVDSGLYDRSLGRYVGYLKKAILPFNNLRMMEDAMLIFRVVRAPQRRAIYIDVSSMQKNKAEQYMKDMMARFKNKMVYDSKTGTLSDRRNIQSMMEDYWLPRRDGGKGTEIQTLDGQDTQNTLQEVEYYRDKLWRALNVPRSRFAEQASSFVFGKGIEIQRDEYRFKKFLDKLRQNFMRMFDDLLYTQLILKNIITEEDWPDIRRYMFWNYAEDNAFVEYKESELINNRVAILSAVEPYVGKYFSQEWVRRKILRFSDQEIKQEDERMDAEPPPMSDQLDAAKLDFEEARAEQLRKTPPKPAFGGSPPAAKPKPKRTDNGS